MKSTDLFFIRYSAVQSELSTRMLEEIGKASQFFDCQIITREALDELPDVYKHWIEDVSAKMPRAKKVGHIALSVPDEVFPGHLTADGVNLLTVIRSRGFITSLKENENGTLGLDDTRHIDYRK